MTAFGHAHLESLENRFTFVRQCGKYEESTTQAWLEHGRSMDEAYTKHGTSMEIARNKKTALFTENGRVAGALAAK